MNQLASLINSLSLKSIKTLLEQATGNVEVEKEMQLQALIHLIALGIGIIGGLMFISMIGKWTLLGLSAIDMWGHIGLILLLGGLAYQLWMQKQVGWIGLKALLVFFVFIRLLELDSQFMPFLDRWQYDMNNIALGGELLLMLGDGVTTVLVVYLILSLNHPAIKESFQISSTTNKVVDFMICLFVACILTIRFLG
ncbi:MAG: hypothetical protein AAF587_36725 [Bacteroidota bacterium]